MSESCHPNFWQGLIMTGYLIIAYWTLYVLIFFPFRFFIPTIVSDSFVYPILSVSYIPLIFFIRKKSGINGFENIKLPNILLLITLTFIAISLYFVCVPFLNPVYLVKLFLTGEINVIGFEHLNFSLDLSLQFIYSLIIAPFFEEIFFRGILLRQFLRKYSPSVALVLSSILFAIVHTSLSNSLWLFLHGCIFGIVYYKTKLLGASIFLHSASNLIGKLLLFRNTTISDQILINSLSIFLLSCICLYYCIQYVDKIKQDPILKSVGDD